MKVASKKYYQNRNTNFWFPVVTPEDARDTEEVLKRRK